MTIDGQITAFSSFNNANCKNGFLYLTKKPEHMMRVATLNVNFILIISFPIGFSGCVILVLDL